MNPIPKVGTARVRKGRCAAFAGGCVMLDWLLSAVVGLGIGIALIGLSVFTALW